MAALDEQVVLVTGGTGQVGWGIAHAALDAGATVLLPSRSESGQTSLHEEFAAAVEAGRVHVLHADVGQPSGAGPLLDLVEQAGRLDHVVAAMGSWWQKGPALEQPIAEIDTLMQAYVTAQLHLAKVTHEPLSRGGGSYTLVTGAAGEHLVPGTGLLVVAVNAQYALARVLMAEHADGPVRYNEVRIATRVERQPRQGVVASKTVGEHFVEVMAGPRRGELIRYPAA